MQKISKQNEGLSPFHAGEQEIQTLTGKRETVESFGRQAIRSFMPDQHRDFFSQLPFLVVGSVDAQGWPWASILAGKPGFLNSPEPNRLKVQATALIGDPLADSIRDGAPLGLLGIEMHTRRRNRLNARVDETKLGGFSLKVDQSFGNCPQYIQTRSLDFVREPGSMNNPEKISSFTEFDDVAKELIRSADTFFVSSYVKTQARPEIEGVDVSHRGGKPGFVKLENNTLKVPDYPGNYLFNTMGNFLLNPKAGLIFVDFKSGDMLLLTGRVEILWGEESEISAFKGAERGWRFTLDHGHWLKAGLPFRASFGSYSPNTMMTGDWAQAKATLDAEAKRDAWRKFRVSRIEDESSVIRSFYLEPVEGEGLLPFEAGQYLTLMIKPDGNKEALIRTYTVSSSPADPYYRISVKRELEGLASSYLHQVIKKNDIVQVKSPRGDFFIDPNVSRPAVLIAGGVGITPMVSMAQHIAHEGARTRHTRPLFVFHSSQTSTQRAFNEAFREIERKTNHTIRYYSFISQPEINDKAGTDYNGSGYMTADTFRQALPLDDYDFYLCGPPAFMQSLYGVLRSLGVRDKRIQVEAFGPASLTREADEVIVTANPQQEADQAIIKFEKSGFEQHWNSGEKTILEVAEQHGLTPDFSCRKGVCGSCVVKLKSGAVAYRTQPSASHQSDEVVICCAVPAKGTGTVEVDL